MSDETHPDPEQVHVDHGAPVGRGVFLGTVVAGVSSLFWGKAAWDRVSSTVSPVAERLVPLLPSSGWRIYSVASHLPTFNPATWRLTIGGHVARRRTLSYAELLKLPRVEQVSTFHCVTGWTINHVHWAGVRLSDVIEPSGPRAGAGALHFVSAEKPYDDYLTMQQANLPDVLLAYEMDGKPLSRGHGSPLRLVIPDMYGYKNVKWLERIDVVPRVQDGYWEALGYDRDAWVGHSNGYGT